jgi:integrative and conjugative element protein (TIGR02256 family)
MSTVELWSSDRRFGLRLDSEAQGRLLELCDQADKWETGGVLIGHYASSLDCAIVTEVTSPPEDSARGRTWFQRGVVGLRSLFLNRWAEERQSYLGDWHFHPGGLPKPSGIDISQMQALAGNKRVRCPYPVLVIVGERDGSRVLSAHVVPHKDVIQLGWVDLDAQEIRGRNGDGR